MSARLMIILCAALPACALITTQVVGTAASTTIKVTGTAASAGIKAAIPNGEKSTPAEEPAEKNRAPRRRR